MIFGGHGAHDLGERPTARVIRDESKKGSWFERLFMRIALQQPEFEIEGIWRWPDLVLAASESRTPPVRAILLYNRKADRMNSAEVKHPKSVKECKPVRKGANQAMVVFDEAGKLGLNADEAIVYACQKRYIFSHAQKGSIQHYKDGQWWNYCSSRKLSKKIKIMGKNLICRTLKNLVKKGVLLSRDDMNEASYDRTFWYCIPGYLTDDLPREGTVSGTKKKARHNGGVPRANGSVNGKAKQNGKASTKGGVLTTEGVSNGVDMGVPDQVRGAVPEQVRQYHRIKDSCSTVVGTAKVGTAEKNDFSDLSIENQDIKINQDAKGSQDSISSDQSISGTGSKDSGTRSDNPSSAFYSHDLVPAEDLDPEESFSALDGKDSGISQERADALKAVLERPEPTAYEKALTEKFKRSKYWEALSPYERYHDEFVNPAWGKFIEEENRDPVAAIRAARSAEIEAIRKARGGQRNIFR